MSLVRVSFLVHCDVDSIDTYLPSESSHDFYDGLEYEGRSDKFQNFLARASYCSSVLDTATFLSQSQAPRSSSSRPSEPQTQGAAYHSRRIILLEDLPNILHPPTRTAFHSSLEEIVYQPVASPIVIIISDAGMRGEGDADGVSSSLRWKSRDMDIVDIRTVLPSSLLNSPYISHIS